MIPKKADAISALVSGPITAATDGSYVVYHDGQTPPTEEEINAKFQELKTAYPMKLLREERDRLIEQSDWRIVKAKETSTNIPAAWKTYRQSLRDLPASSTPKLDSDNNLDMSSVTWPTPPS